MKNILLIVILCVFFNSCKHRSFSDYENPQNFSEIFALFWYKLNNRYVYWDKDPTNWDLIYNKYKPLFDRLDNSDISKRKAVGYFKEMTSSLMDGHFSIIFHDKVISDSIIFPSINRKNKIAYFHDRYNYDDVVKNYLDVGFFSGKGNVNVGGELINSLAGTINKDILYFHCNFFALKKSYESNDGNRVKQTLEFFFSKLKNVSGETKGIILDLRNNSGGDLADLNFIGGKLINRDTLFGFSRSKNGIEKYGYFPWVEAKLKKDLQYNINVPIMILGDIFSASLSETFIIALRSKKNLFIGEQTYGATGPVSDSSIFNSGSFSVGNFLAVTSSSVEFIGANGEFYESRGVTPDIFSPLNYNSLSEGKDVQLEIAISKLN
ncbi:S41 family peptidase [Pedobacter sp. WC2501]|uniref:S41 family peptidase n=1 Tax=Pedobacter sp. WC2501 TaxID=3461400 RepID=UPI00404549B1